MRPVPSAPTSPERKTSLLQAGRCRCGTVTVPAADRCRVCNSLPERIEVEGRGLVQESVILAAAETPGPPITVVRVRLDCGAMVIAEVPVERPLARGDRVTIDSFAGPGRYCVLPPGAG